MKINFYLPGFPRKAMGGYKVVYQYANYLSCRGNDVCIYYGCYDANNKKINYKVKLKCLVKKLVINFFPKWFKLDKKIKQRCIVKITDNSVRNADISIATFILTAQPVSDLSSSKGKKIYFIQDFEAWLKITEKEVIDSYKLHLKKITISNWLKTKIEQNCDDEIALVRNGIDLNCFNIYEKIEDRNQYSVAMLYHVDERKGSKYGIEALKKLHEKYPSLVVNLFGTPPRDNSIPNWMNYFQNASEDDVISILNASSIFLCTSLYEGFGLPGIESMACGCALVTTNSLGASEYANKNNSIIIEPKNVEQIVSSLDLLFSDNDYRIKLANKGYDEIKEFNIESSYKKFEEVLENEQ